MSNFIHQPNDKLFKKAMMDIRVAEDFFIAHLPQEILNTVDFTALKIQKQSFIDANFKTTEADVLYKTKINGKQAYFYLLCENQSTIDQQMAFRLLGYTIQIMQMHLKQNHKSSLPIVYPMVIYTGQPLWDAPLNIFDLFGSEKSLAKRIFLKPYQLIDIQRINDDEIHRHMWSGIVEFALKFQDMRNKEAFLRTLFPWANKIYFYDGSNLAKEVLHYVIHKFEKTDEALINEAANEFLTPELRGETMTLAEHYRQVGLEKGIREGLREGIKEGINKVALELLQNGSEIDFVAKVTKLSLEEIKSIQHESQFCN